MRESNQGHTKNWTIERLPPAGRQPVTDSAYRESARLEGRAVSPH